MFMYSPGPMRHASLVLIKRGEGLLSRNDQHSSDEHPLGSRRATGQMAGFDPSDRLPGSYVAPTSINALGIECTIVHVITETKSLVLEDHTVKTIPGYFPRHPLVHESRGSRVIQTTRV